MTASEPKPGAPSSPIVDEQVAEYMLGTEFGDEQLSAAMEKELRERLEESERTGVALRVYTGYDPSNPDLHLGHSITMRKMRRFQDYGHEVFFLVGTFTALVGDTSDKDQGRALLAQQTILDAGKTYAEQAFKILDREKTNVVYNGDWLSELKASDLFELATSFTVQQFLARDNYRRRISAGDPVGLHEVLYPLLQGYDAVHLRADVQMGATEQLFNIMAGRQLQQNAGQRGCVMLTFPVLVGLDGKERMSKSKGNYVGLTDAPEDQYGKVMSISDDTMRNWIPLVSGWSPARVKEALAELDGRGVHPMDMKKELAASIVTLYHGEDAAARAAEHFATVHQRRELPDEMPTMTVGPDMPTIVEILAAIESVGSKKQARRLIDGGGVEFDGTKVSTPDFTVDHDGVLRVGKRTFVRLTLP